MPERTGLCYIKHVPRQLPTGGRVLVHNCVHAEWQDQNPGVNGSIVGRRGPVVIRTWNRATADGQVCRIIVFRMRATKTRQT